MQSYLRSGLHSLLPLIPLELFSLVTFRFIKGLDKKMHDQDRHVALTLDNFSGHNIAYIPQNIKLVPFEPNLTSHVQPLDAGIIRCFKAHYRRQLCTRAIELDAAGADDIYKVDILEAMRMANTAWEAVSEATIKNCWNHTKILSYVLALFANILSNNLHM